MKNKLKLKVKKRSLMFKKNKKWTDRDLNPGPPPCQGDDLPSELPAHKISDNILYWNSYYKKLFIRIDKIISIIYHQMKI